MRKTVIRSKGILVLGTMALAFLLLLLPHAHARQLIGATDCLECHAEAINEKTYANSVHGVNTCTSCHVDITDLESHAAGVRAPQPVDCSTCHTKESQEYTDSVHHTQEFSCVECHADIHYVKPWEGSKIRIIEKCTSCHEEETYVASGHERAVMRGNNDSAVCSDCHGLHDTQIWHTAGAEYLAEAREFYTRTCNRCHADKDLMTKNNLTTIAVKTYEHSIHGRIQRLGYPGAGCADCHTSHNILPKDDPNSTVNEKNLIEVCSKCHEKINLNFVKYVSHEDLTDHTKYPQLFWTMVFMVCLLVGVFLFFWSHTLLWWRKAYWEKQRIMAEGHLISDKLAHIKDPGETYIRFKPRDRILHLVLIFSFFGLAATGFPIKFPDAPWSQFLLNFIGGVSAARLLHRICAFILIAEYLIVLGYAFHFTFFNKKAGGNWKERLFGPNSLCPRKKDLEDLFAMAKWFIGRGHPPQFDRWTYWEKFDFLAVFWGMAAIGISGIMMWWAQITAKFLPGWILNIARIIHSEEALLAVGFIFTVHFFNTHFIPIKWPMNYSIFTGRVYKWELMEERPLEFERLKRTGELKKLKAPFPGILTNLLAGAIGVSAVILGLLTIFLIIWAFFH